MIIFKTITYKNFLASGAMPITIFLDKSPSTLVIGKNGAGKCVRGCTNIDVQILDPDVKKSFEEFLKSK